MKALELGLFVLGPDELLIMALLCRVHVWLIFVNCRRLRSSIAVSRCPLARTVSLQHANFIVLELHVLYQLLVLLQFAIVDLDHVIGGTLPCVSSLVLSLRENLSVNFL